MGWFTKKSPEEKFLELAKYLIRKSEQYEREIEVKVAKKKELSDYEAGELRQKLSIQQMMKLKSEYLKIKKLLTENPSFIDLVKNHDNKNLRGLLLGLGLLFNE